MRLPVLLFLCVFSLIACGESEQLPPIPDGSPDDWIGGMCGALFGQPTASSGLTGVQCQPSCNCNGRDFSEPEYTADDLDQLRNKVLLTDLEHLSYDPYEDIDQYDGAPTTEVCGFKMDAETEDGYHLKTYADDAEAQADGAQISHYGPCGLCSGFQDLLVYIESPDLTNPVRACGLLGFSEGEESQKDCLRELGFSEPCMEIWYYNTIHTRNVCLRDCLLLLQSPHHVPNGNLNACIQCDEDRSGNVFKAVAGRTRRNSGLATALCRPCDEVFPIDHRYTF